MGSIFLVIKFITSNRFRPFKIIIWWSEWWSDCNENFHENILKH